MSIRERRINVKVKLHTLDYYKCTVTLNVIRYRGTLQSQWSTLTDSTSRKAEENVNVTDESRLAGTEQVVLQMTAEGGDRRGVPNGSG